MKFIFVGAGKIGEKLLSSFVDNNNDIAIIDNDSKVVDSIVQKYDVQGVVGNGIERETLLDAGISNTDFFIASTPRDETNILCCVYAKKLGAKFTIARVRDPEYFSEMLNIKGELGIDLVFNPEFRTAAEISQILKFPSAKSVEALFGGKAILAEFDITDENPLVGKNLIDINAEYNSKVLFGSVIRKGKAIVPKGDLMIESGDSVRIISTESELTAFSKKIHIFKPPTKSAFIIGGGTVAYYLTNKLIESGVAVKIVEQKKERCVELANEFPSALVLMGDGTDSDLLNEERLKDADACIALTGVDEENVILSLYAKNLSVGKTISKIDRASVGEMVKMFGIDSIVNPRDIVANHVIRFVRAHSATSENGVKRLYKIDGGAEALEFIVPEDFSRLGVKLKDIKFKKDVLVGGIFRRGEFVLPTGDSEFMPYDTVLIISGEDGIVELEQVLR